MSNDHNDVNASLGLAINGDTDFLNRQSHSNSKFSDLSLKQRTELNPESIWDESVYHRGFVEFKGDKSTSYLQLNQMQRLGATVVKIYHPTAGGQGGFLFSFESNDNIINKIRIAFGEMIRGIFCIT